MTFSPRLFFDSVRTGILGPTLDPQEVSGCEAILGAFAGEPLSWAAYGLATAYHETAHTMQPIKEMGGPKYLFRMYDPDGARPALAKANGNTQPGDGEKFAGRGFVQITWRGNYRRAGQKLGQPLEANPDLAMRPDIAAAIMVRGMKEGWFTGKSLGHFLPAAGAASREKFVDARRIINGSDKASMIADYALSFQKALQKGNWA